MKINNRLKAAVCSLLPLLALTPEINLGQAKVRFIIFYGILNHNLYDSRVASTFLVAVDQVSVLEPGPEK